ncbi:hypothetical protein ACYX78_05645 [Advenella incenata]
MQRRIDIVKLAAGDQIVDARVVEYRIRITAWDRADLIETRDLLRRQGDFCRSKIALKLDQRAWSNGMRFWTRC